MGGGDTTHGVRPWWCPTNQDECIMDMILFYFHGVLKSINLIKIYFMKKYYSIIVTLVLAAFLLSSCSKESINDSINLPSAPSTTVINTTIAPNQTYQFNVNNPGEVTVAKQAKHYKISEIGSGEESAQVIYKYTPAQDFIGIEEIIVANKKVNPVIQGGSGCSSNHDNNTGDISYSTTYTMIRLNVSN